MAAVDQGQLCQVLEGFLSKENTIRQQAESHFNDWKQKNPDGLVRGLLAVLRASPEAHVRQQSAVAIRSVLRDFTAHRSDLLWNLLSPETKQILKSELLIVLETDAAKSVRRSICDTVSDLAAELTATSQWPELPAKLMQFVESSQSRCQASGLKILGDLVPQLSDIIRNNIAGVAGVVAACAKSEDADVRHQNLCLVTSLVQSEPRSVWKHVQDVVPDIIVGLQTLLQQKADDLAVDMLVKLVELADNSSSFFKPHLAPFVQALFTIARTADAEDEVRQMAVEVLLCIVEDKPRMCLRIHDFVSDLVRILLEFMLTIEDDADWVDRDDSAEEADATRNYDVGESGLDRIAAAMGGENVMNVVFGYVSQYLAKEQWQFKLVAIIAISQTVEYLPEEGIDAHLEEIVNILLAQLNDPHPRVRFAACQAIGQISLDHQPMFQKTYAQVILPVLVNVFDDPSPRVQSHSAAALINFAEEVEKADLMPYVDKLMRKLCERIQPDKPKRIREQCVTSIAVIAGVIEKDFMQYYSFIVPAMKQIIVLSNSKDERAIRGKAVECISIIGLSVGSEMFRADAHDVMQALLQISSTGVESDDPLKEYIQEAFCRMCRTLKAEFVPYLPHLMPNVLKILSIEPQPVNDEEDDVEDMTIVSVAEGHYTGLKTSVIEDMIQAIDLLSTLIEILGEKFGEYLVPSALALLPLLSFPLNDDVKRSALTAMSEVFTAARKLHENNPAAHQTLTLWVGEVLEKVFNDLSPSEDDVGVSDLELMLAETSGLSKCLRNAGPNVLNAQQVAAICEKVFVLMGESSQRRAEIATRKHEPEIDDEDIGRLEEEEGSEQTLRSTLLEIIAAVMSFHSELYLQTGSALSKKFIETHLAPQCAPDDRALALYVSDDILEHLKDKGAPLWPSFASRLVESVSDPDPGVRQAAAFGIIQAAKCSQFPTELIQNAATRFVTLLNATQSREKSSLSATDNVVAALGAIVLHRGQCLQPSPEQYLNLWINNLPLRADDEEGRRVHGDLVDLLVKRSPEVLGPQNCNLPKLAAICASVYRTDFSTDKTDEGIREFMKATGFDVISAIGAKFEKKLQKGLERIHRDVTG